MRLWVCLSFAPCWAFVLIASAFADNPSGAVVDAFRQNAMMAETLRVDWRFTRSETDNYLSSLRFDAEEIRRLSAIDPNVAEQSAQNLLGISESLKRGCVPVTFMTDYWTNRSKHQVRFLSLNQVQTFDDFNHPSHPDSESLPADLLGALSKYNTITFADGSSYRVWWGTANGQSTWRGSEEQSYPMMVGVGDLLPPLSVIGEALNGDGYRLMHPVDIAFIGGDVLTLESGSTVIDGRPVTLITRVDRVKNQKGTFLIHRIFSDVARGAIPLRIEKYECFTDEDSKIICGLPPDRLCDGLAPPFPQQLVVSVKVVEVSPAFFYPGEGEVKEMGAISMVEGVAKEVHAMRTTKWSTFRVEPNKPMSDEMFEAKFPANTLVRYQSTNENKLTGEMDDIGELVTRPIAAGTKPLTSWNWLWWSAAIVPLVLLGVRRFRRRA